MIIILNLPNRVVHINAVLPLLNVRFTSIPDRIKSSATLSKSTDDRNDSLYDIFCTLTV